ncbi:MAG: Na+-dependent transporter, partial [Rhodovibrionaceae bacterium]|nr:Na+-dependent transporter [Rhodovibrionaceae bacterium]
MLRLLGFLGGHATWMLFAGVFIGLALPGLAALARPLLAPAVVLILCATLLRVDWRAMGEYARRPVLASLLTAWLMLVSPVVTWL